MMKSAPTADHPSVDAARVLTLAPSDLTFLLSECRRCFWLKIVSGRRRPSAPMPSVFTRMDRRQRDFFHGKSTEVLSRTLPPGRITCMSTAVLSEPIEVPGSRTRLRFRGALDALLSFDDGSYGIADFKTSSPSEASTVNYRLQLHAYAVALEHAEFPLEPRSPVRRLGLLFVDPGELLSLDPPMR